MKLHRFIIDLNLNQTNLLLTEKGLVHQIKDVLRLKIGEFFILGDGKKFETIARIEEFEKDGIKVSLGQVVENKNEPTIKSHLFCAVLKKENFEWVVQKATEVGVQSITPILTERTIKTNLNMERLGKIAEEAAEQSGRGMIPKINPVTSLENAVMEAKKLERVYVFDLRGKKLHLMEGMATNVGGFIGPEGGFTDEELLFFEASKFLIINLESLTLRAETAAIIASYHITYPS